MGLGLLFDIHVSQFLQWTSILTDCVRTCTCKPTRHQWFRPIIIIFVYWKKPDGL